VILNTCLIKPQRKQDTGQRSLTDDNL
jgi:hypothetical protein